MAHVLARISGVSIGALKERLEADASQHAKQGLILEHIWHDEESDKDVLFLFRSTDLDHARQFIEQTHTEALQHDPDANLPHMTYLIEK
jgi:hypothetical protein